MSLLDTERAARQAEEEARLVAGVIVSLAGKEPADNQVAPIIAETATLIVSTAEVRARVAPKGELDQLLKRERERLADLVEEVETGELSRDAGLARLDRLCEQGFGLWMAAHRRDAWQAAAAELRQLIGMEVADGGR